jgi:hypothetical protein
MFIYWINFIMYDNKNPVVNLRLNSSNLKLNSRNKTISTIVLRLDNSYM